MSWESLWWSFETMCTQKLSQFLRMMEFVLGCTPINVGCDKYLWTLFVNKELTMSLNWGFQHYVHLEVISNFKYDGICVGLHTHQCGMTKISRPYSCTRNWGCPLIKDSRKNVHSKFISFFNYDEICIGLHTHQCGVWQISLDPVPT